MQPNRLFLLVIIICINVSIHGQFTKSQADELIINQILADQIGSVNVFTELDTLTDQTNILQTDSTLIDIPYPTCWVYFVDDVPFANWNHPSRYIFINACDGSDTTINSTIYPMELDSAFTKISMVSIPEPVESFPNPNGVMDSPSLNPHLFALIICCNEDLRFWHNVSAVFNTLIDIYGFKKENIFLHYYIGTSNIHNADFDQDGLADIDYPAHKSNIEQTCLELAGLENEMTEVPELETDDQLFVFVTGHGNTHEGNSTIWFDANEEIYDYELASYMEEISCSQIIFLMGQCYSGGFLDDLVNPSTNFACQNRSFHSAANDSELSWAEVYLTSGLYDEFVYYWTAAARGFYPVKMEPWAIWHETGFFPFNEFIPGHGYDYNPDTNNDGFIQMEEAFNYADDMDSFSENGFFQLHQGFSEPEHPLNENDIGFTSDLLTIAGYAGLITANQVSEPRHYVLCGTINILPGNSLTVSATSTFDLGYNFANLIVQPGANLIIEDDAVFLANNNSTIQISGGIQIGQGVTFDKRQDAAYFGGLFLNNQIATVTFDNVSFNHGQLINYCQNLNFENSNISHTYFGSHRGFVNLESSTFDHVWTYFTNTVNPVPFFTLSITDCIFSNEAHAGINAEYYDRFNIANNQIFNCNGGGISIFNSGRGPSGNQNIAFNEIYNNSSAGISLYNTTASIAGNNIYDNQFGVKFYNNSRVALFGNPTTYDEMNLILDNTSYEFYASGYSFPWYFRYNAIIDEDNLGNPIDPMVYYQLSPFELIPKDIRYNCWGENFVHTEDLYPDIYWYEPVWCPGGDHSFTPDVAEALHSDAINQFEAGYFSNAQNLFELVIQQYPESEYAQSAMKELLRLEHLVNNDYNSLKEYYTTNDTILNDTALTKLGEFLANQCDLTLENWSDAINWYEYKILNPESSEDSIFAIIDLGYVYFLMENQGMKSAYSGALEQFIPATKEQFIEHRDYLLSLLPGDNNSGKKPQLSAESKNGTLFQNLPNPCSDKTKIRYMLHSNAYVKISFRDITGKEIKCIDVGPKQKGTYYCDFLNYDIASGIYFYSLLLDGKAHDTRKMTIIQ